VELVTGDASRKRLAERVTAAAYGTVLVLAALAVLGPDNVEAGHGWEIVAGVGLATWIAHLYAETIGDHLLHGATIGRAEIVRAMADGSPILLAAVPPALVLLLGRLDVLEAGTALVVALVVAFLQLVGVGVFVGRLVSTREGGVWWYAAATAAVGLVVVTVKLVLTH
jgi:hypothetical protein